MGCFDYSCSVSGLPIGWETPVRFMILAENRAARFRGAHEVEGMWRPLALPMRAGYNHYGSIDFDDSPEADALFDVLDRRAIEVVAGKHPRFDMAVTRGMPREDWLSALWLGRVAVETPRGRAEVAQTMIREDIWRYLLENSGMTSDTPIPQHHLDATMRLETAFDAELIRNPKYDGALRELYAVTHALKRLGRPWWTPGTCCGPQDGVWDFHKRFAQKVASIAARAIEQYTTDE